MVSTETCPAKWSVNTMTGPAGHYNWPSKVLSLHPTTGPAKFCRSTLSLGKQSFVALPYHWASEVCRSALPLGKQSFVAPSYHWTSKVLLLRPTTGPAKFCRFALPLGQQSLVGYGLIGVTPRWVWSNRRHTHTAMSHLHCHINLKESGNILG